MKMLSLRLYEIPFSHFCDKVRWALDFYSIPYERINYSGSKTPGLEKAPRSLQKLTPIIEDPNNHSSFISDSTPILIYLDEHYRNDKTLFPVNTTSEKDAIIQYCLKLDSQLGLYARRLAYLHVISEKPAILSVFLDGNYDRNSRDDWKSYFLGLFGSSLIIGRLGIDRIREENIFEKTICLCEEIQEDLNGKEYLFNNQFSAADLTLTSLLQPLRSVTSLLIKYKSIFQYADRIRERHYLGKYQETYAERLLYRQRRQKKALSFIQMFIFIISYILLYPLQFFIHRNEEKKGLLQYPSTNPDVKANNDARVMKLNSILNTAKFFIPSLYHLFFTLPRQMDFINNEGKKLLHKQT